MKSWTWQKWLGKITPIAVGLLTQGVWDFFELPQPTWAGAIAGVITLVVQTILSLIPPKPAA